MIVRTEFLYDPAIREYTDRQHWENIVESRMVDELSKELSKHKEIVTITWSARNVLGKESYHGGLYAFNFGYREHLIKLAREFGVPENKLDEFVYKALNY